jgi:hypothetical protein
MTPLLLLHVPPGVASLSVTEAPTQRSKGAPDISAGIALTVTVTSKVEVGQPSLGSYVIVVVPTLRPATIPVVPTVPTAVLLLLHVPPEVASVRDIVPP